MECAYYDAGRCRSCTLMGVPYPEQLAAKQRRVTAALDHRFQWSAPQTSAEAGFRNKAKWVVGGRRGRPTLGILGPDNRGVDLRECGLCEPGLITAFGVLAEFIADRGLIPYDVPGRSGELKYLIVTRSPTGALMVRFVLRSTTHLASIADGMVDLQRRLPELAVASVNLHPEHRAVLEGDTELPVTDRQVLQMPVNGIDLHLRPRSFFQTNTAVAAALYRQAANWVDDVAPDSLWDLYCGVGGFALHCASAGRRSVGIEVSAEAIEGAAAAAALLPEGRGSEIEFHVGDATDVVLTHRSPAPELVIVNPPRRGIGEQLAGWLAGSSVRHLLYSSCNVTSLAADLALMPDWKPLRARLFDMFPQTDHHEVLVLLANTAAGRG